MAIQDQVKKSQLSKQGRTNPTGKWEGVPSNVAAVARTSFPRASAVVPPIINPIDMTTNVLPQPTYLTYMQVANKM